jgi:hypothetical protein
MEPLARTQADIEALQNEVLRRRRAMGGTSYHIVIAGPITSKNASRNITRALAIAFTMRLHWTISDGAWDEMVALNATPDFQAGACASQNYCDANEIMLQAFRDVTQNQPDPADEIDAAFMRDAWAIARRIWSAMA